MTENGYPDKGELDPEQQRQRARDQIEIIREALGPDEIGVALPRDSDSQDFADFEYLYRQRSLLVRDEDVARVLAALSGRAARAEDLVNGLTRLELLGGEDIPDVLDRLDEIVGVGVATPDHVVYVTPGRCCPATEPEEPHTHEPLPSYDPTSEDGAGVFVSVVDTGWHPPAATDPISPWLEGVTGDVETFDKDDIRPYVGHGTFIAGVVRCVAPRTEIRVEGFLPVGGAILESKMIRQLVQALALGPDIISLSAGCTTRGGRPAMGFEVFWEKFLSHVKGTVLVAAAGNDSTRVPFWPAAFPWALSVGAIDAEKKRAGFSNFGSWVDVYALGVDMVNAYPHGTFFTHEPPEPLHQKRVFEGLARWSGTSFSTPLVAGMIAARMSQLGISARTAADQLLAEAQTNAVPGVGPVL